MTWRSVVLILLFLSVVILSDSRVRTKQSSDGWKEYPSLEGRFSVLLPGEPTSASRPRGSDSPGSLIYVISVDSGNSAYSVGYFDLAAPPPDEKAIEKILDQARQPLMNTPSLRLIDEKDGTFQGFTGRSVTLTASDQRIIFSRLILVKKRVYRIWMQVPSSEARSNIVERFFDSFKVTP